MRKRFALFFLLVFCQMNGVIAQSKIVLDPFNYDRNAYEKVHINYKVEGIGDTVLFFIHGWNLNHRYWNNQIEVFKSSYKTVTVDLAGHGESGDDRINWTIESFAKDLCQIIRKEQLKNVILIAHSMAGEIAVDMIDYGCSQCIGIIGIDNFKQVGLTVTQEQKHGIIPYAKEFIANYQLKAEAMAKEYIKTTNDSLAAAIINDYKNADPEIAVSILMNLFPKAAEIKYKLPKLPFVLKIILNDTPFDEEALKKYCANGYKIKVVRECGHFPMVEKPVEFNAVLNELLKDN